MFTCYFIHVVVESNSCLCSIKEVSSSGDTVQKIDKHPLTAVIFIHFDCSTVNIQKADVYRVETPGALASDQPMKPQQRGQDGGPCECVHLCVNRFTGIEPSVTAINVTSLQTSYSTYRKRVGVIQLQVQNE